MKKILKKPQNIVKHEKTEIRNTSSATGEEQEKSSRRYFLKKSAYVAPVLMALGQLVKPTNVQALGSVPGPPPIW